MATEYRKERKRWGYRFSLHGRSYKRYAWGTEAEARQAEAELRVEIARRPVLPRTAFVTIVAAYLVEAARLGRSVHRVNALEINFRRFIVPFFGEATAVESISHKDVERFIAVQAGRGVKNSTVWHYVSDLRACLNYAIREGLLRENVVMRADKSRIKFRKVIKPPMDPGAVDVAARAISSPYDRAWFDVVRFTGMRRAEANRLCWDDIAFGLSMIRIRGTKSEGADAWLPLAPVALRTLMDLRQIAEAGNPLVFPGRSAQSKGKVVIDRGLIFKRIRKSTGIKLTSRDLRDYFCNEVAANTHDAAVLMRLMRHTSLQTTTKYLRTVNERMEDAVKNLGATYGGGLSARPGIKTAQNDIEAHGVEVMEQQLSIRSSDGISDSVGSSKTAVQMPHRHADDNKKH